MEDLLAPARSSGTFVGKQTMQLRHNIQSHRTEGFRISEELKSGRPLALDDLKKVRDIVDESESIAIGLLTLYGSSVLLAMALILILRYLFHIDTTEFAILIIAPIFVLFTIHFLFEFRTDNCRKQIESRLKCRCCDRRIAGISIHLVLANEYCPFCKASVAKLLGLESTLKTKIDEPSDGPESPTGRIDNG